MEKKFELGQVVTTPGADTALQGQGFAGVEMLKRHRTGDWGDMGPEDCEENELSLKEGYRLMSSYKTQDGVVIWIITEADRSATTFLLPDEY